MPATCLTSCPVFLEHVKSSCLQKFSPLYFTVGLVEEVAELVEEIDQFQLKKNGDKSEIVSEVGDVCWYLYALCNSLTGITPIPSTSEDTSALEADSRSILSACGKLCGSIKKWSRGDKSWDIFQPRIQKEVSDLLQLVVLISSVPLEVAMKKNIEKIRERRVRGVVKGDGNNR